MHPSWQAALAPVGDALELLLRRADRERANGVTVVPAQDHILRAFEQPLNKVRVVIIGQDPYPNAGHATGLAFDVPRGTHPLPPSLRNILTEWSTDLGRPIPATCDLSQWAEEGVLLLNTSLTTVEGERAAHAKWGWQAVAEAAIQAIDATGQPCVGLLWGAHAQSLQPAFGSIPVITSAHPSPLSASRGFFGSRPFTCVNAQLVQLGAEPLEWRLG